MFLYFFHLNNFLIHLSYQLLSHNFDKHQNDQNFYLEVAEAVFLQDHFGLRVLFQRILLAQNLSGNLRLEFISMVVSRRNQSCVAPFPKVRESCLNSILRLDHKRL